VTEAANIMAIQHFLTKEQEKQVVDAIGRAESETSAEVRVHIEEHCAGDNPLKRAEKVFHHLGMTHTKLQNGVLIYVASEDRKAAVFGGKGIHKQVEPNYWQDVLTPILNHFKQGNFAEGLVNGIEEIGRKLKEHFPHHKGDINQLPDEIDYGSPNE
jgi:uncharacterized membrane protein